MCQLGVIQYKQAFSAAEVTWEEYFFCSPSPGMFLFILCLSRMISEISHGSLLTARYSELAYWPSAPFKDHCLAMDIFGAISISSHTAFTQCSTSRSRPSSWGSPSSWNSSLSRSHAVLKGGAAPAPGTLHDRRQTKKCARFECTCSTVNRSDPISVIRSTAIYVPTVSNWALFKGKAECHPYMIFFISRIIQFLFTNASRKHSENGSPIAFIHR